MPDETLLRTFAENTLLLDAVKKLVRSQFLHDKIDVGMSNEILGQKTRARLEGLQKVDEAFRRIEAFRKTKGKDISINDAR